MAKTELKEQLKSYEGYINDIPLIIDPCKICKTYKKHVCKTYKKHDGWFVGEYKNGEWKYGPCKECCWFYDSKFEIGGKQ